MNSSSQDRRCARQDFDSGRSIRLPLRIGSLIVGILACGALLTLAPRRPPPIREAGAEPSTPNPADSPPSKHEEDTVIIRKQKATGKGKSQQTAAAAMPTPTPASSSLPERTAEARQWVDTLFQPGTALTEERAVQWRRSLQQLVQEGAAAV